MDPLQGGSFFEGFFFKVFHDIFMIFLKDFLIFSKFFMIFSLYLSYIFFGANLFVGKWTKEEDCFFGLYFLHIHPCAHAPVHAISITHVSVHFSDFAPAPATTPFHASVHFPDFDPAPATTPAHASVHFLGPAFS